MPQRQMADCAFYATYPHSSQSNDATDLVESVLSECSLLQLQFITNHLPPDLSTLMSITQTR